jgi:cupin 2 domain-containing protein
LRTTATAEALAADFEHAGNRATGRFEAPVHVSDNCGMNNLFSDIPHAAAEEFFETLVSGRDLRVERIVSRGHSAPESGWFDQDEHEFIVLLGGSAGLEFDDGSRVELGPGDWLDIPARRRHRVAWTGENEETVWLAVYYRRE